MKVVHTKRLREDGAIEINPNQLRIKCPACGEHRIDIKEDRQEQSPNIHGWNGSYDAPTFTPSLLLKERAYICHSYIKNGYIEFLSDCTHKHAGQLLELQEAGG